MTVTPLFAPSSSAQVVITATNEGLATNFVLTLGPKGSLHGTVTRADGTTPVSGAEVTVQRNQPLQQVGTFITDSSGGYSIPDIAGGQFTLSVIDPATGDRGRGFGTIVNDGDNSQADIRLNGQGTVTVQVVDGSDAPVAGLPITITSLTMFRDTRTTDGDGNGQAVFTGFPAGDLTVSTRQASTNLLGTALAKLVVNGNLAITVKLQPIGTIQGTVLATDGVTPLGGVQVKLMSLAKGLITQTVTGADGLFSFDSLPTSDSPYTLDAVQNGRLRARVQNLVLSTGGQVLTQNLALTPVGSVTGQVLTPGGAPAAGASVVVQSLGGLRATFNTTTNTSGVYRVDGVPQGNFAVVANASGATATTNGTIVNDGDVITVNIQLQANGLIGVVYGRDGQTPVGAGVTVTLNPGNQTTTTDAQGGFGFAAVTPNSYTLEAADTQGNRGRTQLVVTTVDSTKALVANITFLGRGQVTGAVRDANGNIQAAQTVTFTSQGIFGGSATATTDATGHYQFNGVFVGDFTVSAQNPTTRLAGVAKGTLLGDGETVNADVTLRATGSVVGRAIKVDGTVLAGARVELKIGGSVIATTTSDATGAYRFDLVPLGDFTLVVTDLATGDKGLTNSSLSTLNEVRTADVHLIGQGQVVVHIIDGNGQPVSGARVTLNSSSLFGGSFSTTTDTTGVVTFTPVFSGDFTASASKPAQVGSISGSTAGTVIPGQTTNVSITLTSRPVGRIAGIVYAPDAITPLPGVTVRLAPFNRDIQSGVDGSFVFNDLEGGTTFTVSALVNGRVRARSGNLQISSNGETVTQNLTLIGIGSVHGTVTDANQQAVGGITVRLVNPDPVLGGTFTATTQSDGTYNLVQIPAGNFSITAANAANTLRAEGGGRVGFDGDSVTVNLVLVDNAITMPRSLYDANNMLFDIQGNGSIGVGTNSAFAGNGGADRQGMRLDVVSSGTAIPFTNGNGTVGSIGLFNQQVTVDEVNALGLKVTRRVYAPKNGYFARYLEIIENPTTAPITVDLRVTSNFSANSGNGNARVADSSDGDDVLSVANSTNPDRWVVVDDLLDADPYLNSSIPASAFVFDGAGAAERAGDAGLSLVGLVGKLTYQWNTVTIQPGATVAYMHFAVQQINRAAARAAAERLSQLPPEAIEGLTPVELSAIRNFAVPVDGVSTVTPLPAIDVAQIQGQVLSGDGTSPIANASVDFQSQHPLFSHHLGATTDAQGRFSFKARISGDGRSVAIPLAPFILSAKHPQTQESTPNTPISFPATETALTHDLVFINTGNVRGTVTRHNGSLVSSGSVSLLLPNGNRIYAQIDSNGNYGFTGMRQGDYDFEAKVPHPQGQELLGYGHFAVVAGQTAIGNITMDPTGAVSGTVRNYGGEPVVNASVILDINKYPPYRTTRTDTAGQFLFSDVSLGGHTVTTVEPRTNAQVSSTVNVGTDITTTTALTYPGVGTIAVQVNYARGGGAANAMVRIGYTSLQTDSTGRANFTEVVGTYGIAATHPNNGRLTANTVANLNNDGETVSATITLPAAGVVTGTVRRADGVTRAPGLNVSLLSYNPVQAGATLSANTDAQGVYRIAGVPDGSFYLKAIDTTNATFADASNAISTDGQELVVDLTLANNTIPLPASRRDANNFLSDIQPNGAVLTGTNGVFNVGAMPRRGASLLQISDTGGSTQFSGNNSATLSALGRQLTIAQATPVAGLRVTRKVYVPSGGYFTRYLEILENPGTSPITVDVENDTRYYTNAILGTSSGDLNLATGANPDYWVMLDDSIDNDPFMTGSLPTTAHVFGAPGATHPADVLDFRVEGDGGRTMSYRFNAVTVPAGGKVVLMHFVVQQVNRAGATAAAQRLLQLPPEALDALQPDEIAAIINMPVPADGLSTVAPLPSLYGTVSGRVLEGDNATVVPSAYVRVRSAHPLFARTWQYGPWYGQESSCGQSYDGSLVANATGNYSLVGRLVDGQSIPIPVDSGVMVQVVPDGCYDVTRGHPVTGVQSQIYTPQFATGSTAIVQDVLFPTGILTGTVVGPADYGVTGGTVSKPAANGTRAGAVSVRNDGTYTYPGLAAGTYTLNVSVPHNQGTALTGSRSDAVATVGSVTVLDIPLQSTGAISGTVVTANGEASINSRVQITAGSFQRTAYSDSLGRYAFSAVPVGSYVMTVRDALSGATTTIQAVTVGQNQTTTQNVVLVGLGSIQLQVNYARGIGAFDAPVYIQSQALGSSEVLAGRTDLSGHLTVANVPIGNYTLRARHPAVNALDTVMTGTMSANGETQQQTMTLRAVASIALTVLDQDHANVPAAGANVVLTDLFNTNRLIGTTNSSGQLTVPNIAEGNYSIAVTNVSSGATGGLTGTIAVADDGQTLPRSVSITADRSVTGVIDYAGERDLYTIQANAGDVISVSIHGTAVNTSPSIYITRAWIFSPTLTQLARGYGYDATNNNLQYNEFGNLTNTVAGTTGRYTITVSPYYSNVTGGYRLSVSVNGIPVAITPYADGSTLTGKLTRSDGVTPIAGQRLNLFTSGNPGLNANVITDAAGIYTFTGVPLQSYTLAAIDPADQRKPISVSGQLTVAGQTYTRDLVMPLKNTLNLSVMDAAGATAPSGTPVSVTDAVGARNFTSDGAGHISATVYGSTINLVASHPMNTYLKTSTTVTATTDGDVVSASISLPATGSVTGHVYSGSSPVPNAQVSVSYYVPNYCCQLTRYASTDASGSYTLTYLPVGVPLTIQTYHPQNGTIKTSTNTQLSANNETRTVDLVLASIGSISGRLTYASGSPAPSTYVYAVNPTTSNSYASFYTDAAGYYQFNAIEVGVPVQIAAQHRQTLVWTSITTSLTTAGQILTDQNVVLAAAGSITGRVVNASGTPLAGRPVTAYYVYGLGSVSTYSRQATTDANGMYRIDNLPGDQAIRLVTPHPTISSMLAETTATISTDGQIVTAPDLVNVGVGSIVGQVQSASGTLLANSYVTATFTYDFTNHYTRNYGAYTDASGQYRFDNLPVGQAIALRARHPNSSNIYADASATLSTDGEVLTAPVIQLPAIGSLRVSLVDAEGVVPNNYLYVYVQDALSTTERYRGYIYGTTQPNALVADMPTGPYTVRVTNSNGGYELARATGTITSEAEVPVNLTTSLVKGTVYFADGTTVQNPSVFVNQTDPVNGMRTYYPDTVAADGSYRVLGVSPGSFSLTAQDPSSGLQSVVAGTLAATDTPVILDATLPQSATVTGTVRDSAGNALANVSVAITSSSLAYARWFSTDASGNYSADHIALGDVTVYAYGQNGFIGTSNATLTTANTTVVIDVLMPETASLTGTVYASDGTTTVSNAYVSLQSLVGASPLGQFSTSVQANAGGIYTIAAAPAGPASITAWDPVNPQTAGRTAVTLAAGSNTQNVTLGNAARFTFNLDGSDGYRYDVNCDGSLVDGGTVDRSQNDAYDGTYYLAVNGNSQSCADSGVLESNGRQVVLGPSAMGSVEVTRKVFVPASGGYARYVEIIRNPGTTDVTVPVEITGNLGSDGSTRIVVAPAATNSKYAVTDQNGLCCDPALGHVFGGTGAALAVGSTQFANGNDNIVYRWQVPVPAGRTVAIMHFAIQRGVTATADVQSQAESLVNMTDAHMFDGLTAGEKAQVLNYAIP